MSATMGAIVKDQFCPKIYSLTHFSISHESFLNLKFLLYNTTWPFDVKTLKSSHESIQSTWNTKYNLYYFLKNVPIWNEIRILDDSGIRSNEDIAITK